MAKRQITISAYPLNEVGPHSYTVSLSFSDKGPSKRFDIETVADCKVALANFAEELESVRQALALERHVRQTLRPQARRFR